MAKGWGCVGGEGRGEMRLGMLVVVDSKWPCVSHEGESVYHERPCGFSEGLAGFHFQSAFAIAVAGMGATQAPRACDCHQGEASW